MKRRIRFMSLVFSLGFGLLSDAGGKAAREWPLLASFDFEDGRVAGLRPHDPAHWRIVESDGSMVYDLATPGKQGKVRAPRSWSLIGSHDVASFEFTDRLKCNADTANSHRDLCVFFHFQDPTHFCYVHFSATSDKFHNIIGLVNGADRHKINAEPAGESVFRLTDQKWHEFKVSYDEKTGVIQVYLDDMETPILTGVDKTLGHGLVGVGSFDDTGFFDDLKLWGNLII